MNATVRYVQKLQARFKHAPEGCIVFPARMGRPPRGPPTKSERSAVVNMRCALKSGAGLMWDRLKRSGTAVPKGVAHAILREYGEAVERKRKQARRRRMRHGRKHSNSMRHTDYKRLDDGRRFTSYMDGASRLIVWRGAFDEATGKHAVEVPEEAMSKHGKPASMLSDRGTRFYAAESEKKAKGVSRFEKPPNDLGILHVPAGVAHSRTNGKLERARGETRRKLRLFRDVAGRPGVCPVNQPHIEADPTARFVRWRSYERPHMSLNTDVEETPAMAFKRKTFPPGSDVTDE